MFTIVVCGISMLLGFFCAAAFSLSYEKDVSSQLTEALDRVKLLELQLSNETLAARQLRRERDQALAHLSGANVKGGS
jgi:hypothetical protein